MCAARVVGPERGADHPRVQGVRSDGAALEFPGELVGEEDVGELRCTDKVVQRHPIRLRQRQEQLQAGPSLTRFQSRQGALGDAGRLGEGGERYSTVRPQLLEPRADLVQCLGDS